VKAAFEAELAKFVEDRRKATEKVEAKEDTGKASADAEEKADDD